MRSIVGVLAGAVMLAGAIQTPALAQQIQRPRLGRLELTEEQEAQIEQLREKHRDEAAKAREELVKARAELAVLRAGADFDLKEYEQALNNLSRLQNAEVIRGLESRREMMGLLTEEQLGMVNQGRRLLASRYVGNRTQGFRGQVFGGRGGRAMTGRGRAYQQGRAGWARTPRPGIQRGRAAIPPAGRGIQPGNTVRQFRGRGMPPPA